MNTVFEGSFLTEHICETDTSMSFSKIDDISQYINADVSASKKRLYVVPTLSADYFLLFSTATAIVTFAGSPLSHLSLLAREHNVPVFLAENNEFSSIPESGECTLRVKE